ncbi:MAG: MinD/ParA family protein [Alicyclobacillaceae bacterium]|nr:MinD/ParA family protein [Alicyclobacillaceae bacterium]
MDQAAFLRQRVARKHRPADGVSKMRTLAVTSGKGGVGKSNLAVNVAIAAQEAGFRTLILDADVGFANIDVLLGERSRRTIVDLTRAGVSARDVIQSGPGGLRWISGGTALAEWFQMSKEQALMCLEKLQDLEEEIDWVIIDTGAGLSDYKLQMLEAAAEILLVTTPEPTALADAYALMKVLVGRSRSLHIQVVVNRCRSFTEGLEISNRLVAASRQFLNYIPSVAGYVLEDPALGKAVIRQIPVLLGAPKSRASECIRRVAHRVLSESDGSVETPPARGGWRDFVWKLQHYVFGRG